MAESMCVVPWSSLVVQPDGRANFCCDAPLSLTVDGRPGQLGRDSFDDLWNSVELVEVRDAMAHGERPVACQACWDREDEGVTSRRHVYNGVYRQAQGEMDLVVIAEAARTTRGRVDRAPDWFVVELGSVCNLKCRSCGPLSSSRIAADSLHAAWNDTPDVRRAPSGAHDGTWFRQVDDLADMIAAGAQGTAMLSLMGGEPFLIKQTWELLEGLIDRGVAHNIFAGLSTNGQVRSRRMEELAPHFRGFNLSISIDGYGPLYEYLRSGGTWTRLVDNIDYFQSLPAPISVAITPTLQNTNALDMVRLIGFLEDRDLQIAYNAVDFPARLRADNLPAPIKQRAATRLREYMALSCLPKNAGVIRAYCERLELEQPGFDEALFEEYLTFTAELDASRGESLATAAPDLVEAFALEGVA